MRILGIDPGSRVTGYGLVDSVKNQHHYVASGCIRTQTKDFPQRLGDIFHAMQDVINKYQPDHVAVEQVFVANNASAALKLGQARGAAITAAVNAGLPVFEYTPRAVKQALVGTGAAGKEQVQHMVRILLNLRQSMGLDESDAIAVALCHAHSHAVLSKLRASA